MKREVFNFTPHTINETIEGKSYPSIGNIRVSSKRYESSIGKILFNVVFGDLEGWESLYWEETCEEDSLPEGMGVSTKETSDEKRKKEIEDLEKEMGQKVKEFSDKLNNISEKRKDHEELYKGHIS